MIEATGFKSILVPLDGSELAERALPVGTMLAGRGGIPLHLVSVSEPLIAIPNAVEFPDSILHLQAALREQLSQYHSRVVASARKDGAPVIRTAMLDGMAAPTLGRYILDQSIGLVVMTTHGRGGLNRLWLGSVADRLLRTAGVPMLLLRSPDQPQPFTVRRMLVALDGEIEQEVLGAALGLLGMMPEASVMLTRIVEPPVPGLTRLAVRPAPFGSDWVQRHEIEARNYLAGLTERLRPQVHAIDFQVLVGRPVADQILGLARAIGADLVVLGTHGARGVERLLLGSIADKTIRISELPLLVAPVRRSRKGHDHATAL